MSDQSRSTSPAIAREASNRSWSASVSAVSAASTRWSSRWAGTGGEGAKYWLQVLTEIKNRGTEDVCMVVCDGLKGLPDAVANTWQLAVVQTSLVHHGGARDRPGCHPCRGERASADRPSRSRR